MNLFEGGGGNSILVNIIEVPEGKQFYRAFGPFWFSSVVQITDVLRKHAARLEEISFLLSADVHRLINDEAMVSPPYWEAVLPVRRERSEIPPPSFIPPPELYSSPVQMETITSAHQSLPRRRGAPILRVPHHFNSSSLV